MSTKAYIDSATAAIVQPMIDARDARIAELEAALNWIVDACPEVGDSIGGYPTGTAAIRAHAQRTLRGVTSE